ncbi:MAG: hypothetical protein AAFV45_02720 [Pseudomonadota bacterium]
MTTAYGAPDHDTSSAGTSGIVHWARWSAGAALWLVLAFGLPVAAETANLFQINRFPAGFYLIAQAAPILLGCLGLWLASYAARRRYLTRCPATSRTGSDTDHLASEIGSAHLNRSEGLIWALAILAPAVILFATAKIYADGFDGLLTGHGVMSGIVLWLLLLVRPQSPLRADPAPSSPAGARRDNSAQNDQPHLDEKSFGVTDWGLVILFGLAVLPLAVAHIEMAATIAGASQVIGLDRTEILALVAVCAVVISWLVINTIARAIISISAFVILTGLILATGVFQFTGPSPYVTGHPLPQLTYGQDLSEISRLQRDLVLTERADPVTTRQFTRPWTGLTTLNALLFVLAVAASTAVMLHILSMVRARRAHHTAASSLDRHNTNGSKSPNQSGLHWLILSAMIVVITLPVLPSQLRHIHYAEIESGVARNALSPWMERTLDNGWARLCSPVTENAGPTTASTADGTAAGDGETIPEWWLETDPSMVATDLEATTSGPEQTAMGVAGEADRPNSLDPNQPIVSPNTRDLDALVSQYMAFNHICLSQVALNQNVTDQEGPRLSAGDLAPIGAALFPIAATMAGARDGELLGVQAGIIAALIVGLSVMLILLGHMFSATTQTKTTKAASMLVQSVFATLAATLAFALPQSGIVVENLPVWTFALLSGAVAPALLIGATLASARVGQPLGARLAILVMVPMAAVLAYLLATSALSAEFAILLAPYSDAPGWKLENLADLQSACLHLGSDACLAARELSKQTTNIAGIRPEAVGAIIGLLVALPVMISIRLFRSLQ